MAKPKSAFYTLGRFSRGYRGTTDTESGTLYAKGMYKTKLKKEDLPEWYIPFHSKAISYMNGYISVKDVVEVAYTSVEENHVFKDDYIYLCYEGNLIPERGYNNKIIHYDNAIWVCGWDIIPILEAIEKYSPDVGTSLVRSQIKQKIDWLRENESEFYMSVFGTDKPIDVFDWYHKHNG